MSMPHGEGRMRGGRQSLRPEDLPSTPVSLRRVASLFGPYRMRLTWLF